jgi:membrane protease YdiL (CAAX protease family)
MPNLLFLFVLGVIVPLLSIQSSRQSGLILLPRRTLYYSSVVSEWVLTSIGALIILGTAIRVPVFKSPGWGRLMLWTALISAIALGSLAVFVVLERFDWWPRETPLVRYLMPETREEKLICLFVLAPTAGICEEFLYRGYLYSQLSARLHSPIAAWIASSAAFGMGHAYQSLNGAARAALLGALLAWPVFRLGCIYPSVIAHFLLDAAALLWLGPLAWRKPNES